MVSNQLVKIVVEFSVLCRWMLCAVSYLRLIADSALHSHRAAGRVAVMSWDQTPRDKKLCRNEGGRAARGKVGIALRSLSMPLCLLTILAEHLKVDERQTLMTLQHPLNAGAGRRSSGNIKSAQKNGKKRRRRTSSNPFIDAVMLEDQAHGGMHEEDDDGSDAYSDLEDFIVCKPGETAATTQR